MEATCKLIGSLTLLQIQPEMYARVNNACLLALNATTIVYDATRLKYDVNDVHVEALIV